MKNAYKTVFLLSYMKKNQYHSHGCMLNMKLTESYMKKLILLSCPIVLGTLSHSVSWQPHGDDKSPGSDCSQPRNTVGQYLTDLCLMLIMLGSFLSTDLSKHKYIYVQCLWCVHYIVLMS